MRIPIAVAAGALLAAFATACGAQAPTAHPPTPRPTATGVPAQLTETPAPADAGGADGAATAWRTDLETGGRVGNAAPNATVTLSNGTRATLEEVAGGKPLLLYFFATW